MLVIWSRVAFHQLEWLHSLFYTVFYISALLSFLEAKNLEGLAEATRVYGNLSRDKSVRDFLVQNKGELSSNWLALISDISKFPCICFPCMCAVDEAMVAMLDSDNREVVYTACGVLINLMADDEKRKVLRKQGGVSKWVHLHVTCLLWCFLKRIFSLAVDWWMCCEILGSQTGSWRPWCVRHCGITVAKSPAAMRALVKVKLPNFKICSLNILVMLSSDGSVSVLSSAGFAHFLLGCFQMRKSFSVIQNTMKLCRTIFKKSGRTTSVLLPQNSWNELNHTSRILSLYKGQAMEMCACDFCWC